MISSVEYSSLGAAAYRSDFCPVALYSPRTAFSGCRSGSRGVYTPQRVWIEDETGKLVEERTDFQAVGLSSRYCYDPITIDGLVFHRLLRIVQRKTPNPLFSESTAVLIEVADISVSKG